MDDDNCLLLEREGKDQRPGHSSRSCLLSQRYLTFCVLGKYKSCGRSAKKQSIMARVFSMSAPMAAVVVVLVALLAASNADAQATPSAVRHVIPNERCRMQDGSAHSYCGLPYELSNFQVRTKECKSKCLRVSHLKPS